MIGQKDSLDRPPQGAIASDHANKVTSRTCKKWFQKLIDLYMALQIYPHTILVYKDGIPSCKSINHVDPIVVGQNGDVLPIAGRNLGRILASLGKEGIEISRTAQKDWYRKINWSEENRKPTNCEEKYTYKLRHSDEHWRTNNDCKLTNFKRKKHDCKQINPEWVILTKYSQKTKTTIEGRYADEIEKVNRKRWYDISNETITIGKRT